MKTEKKRKAAPAAVKKAAARAGTSAKKTGKPPKSDNARTKPAKKSVTVKKAATIKPESISRTARKKTTEKLLKKTGGVTPVRDSGGALNPAAEQRGSIPKRVKAKKTAGRNKPGAKTRKAGEKKEAIGRVQKPAVLSEEGKKAGKVPELPEEYGENRLFLIVVDPNVVYYGWEIKKEDIPERKGDLTLRIFDVTGTGPETVSSGTYVDIRINSRVGSGFFETRMHGREIIAELGVSGKGRKYRAILKSSRVSMPELLTFDELGIARKLFESGIPVGY